MLRTHRSPKALGFSSLVTQEKMSLVVSGFIAVALASTGLELGVLEMFAWSGLLAIWID